MSLSVDEYRDLWLRKTVKQIECEIESMRKYMQRHSQAYAWHGKNMTAPGSLADGDKLLALREALRLKTESQPS